MGSLQQCHIIEFNQAKKRTQNKLRARRIKVLQERFRRAMGWEATPKPKLETPTKGRRRKRSER